ncbi:MAG TPA: hypothetical protein VF205_06820 [Nitrospiraceae bacterium]
MAWEAVYGTVEKSVNQQPLTALVKRAQNLIASLQGMGQLAERFAEGAGTLREFAEEESGN